MGDGSLTRNISVLRKHLGADTIETLPKHGYRFTESISVVSGSEAQIFEAQAEFNPPITNPVPQGQPEASRRNLIWIGGLSLLLCVLLGSWALSRSLLRRPSVVERAAPLRIAVLPLQNLSTEPDDLYLSQTLTEELVTALGQSNRAHLRVLAPGSTAGYQNTSQPVQVAQELGVQYLVVGTIQRYDHEVEIVAHLVNGSNQEVIWSGKYHRPLQDFPAVQAEVADSVAREVQVNVLPEALRDLGPKETLNPIAYEAYLHGRMDLDRRTVPAFHAALEHFKDATVRDPKYSHAYAGLSETYLNLATNIPTKPAYAYAKEAALTAIRLDDQVAEAHRDLAYVLANSESDWDGAEREYRRALELNPSDARAHHWYAMHLISQRNPQGALREAQAGLELDPLSLPSNYNYGFMLIEAGQIDAGIEHLNHLLVREPNSEVVYGYLGIGYNRKHEYERGAAAFHRAMELSTLKRQYSAGEAQSLALAGKTDEARKIVAQLQRQIDQGMWMPSCPLAVAYFALGDRDHGFASLERAVKESSCTLFELNTEPELLVVRTDPRFASIRARFHLVNPENKPATTASTTQAR